ncbi:MAG TPA: hypothetical protein P5270_08675, partial [Victivallales bacterium]|nr:hypothetical protein [Victivallales bacterium]
LADKTNNNWVLLYEIINIPADSKKCELVIDLPGVIAETCVDDIKVYPNPGKIYPLEILETAGKFDYLRTRKPVSPPGWIMDYNINKMDNPPIRIEREGNESFLRVENDNPTKTVVLDNYFSLDTNWKKINIKAKIRTKNLKCGNEGWQNARVMVTFVDKIGQKVGGYGECPEAKTDQNWTEKSVVREIPEGAAGVRLQVGLFNATGIADFDDISISKAE